MNKNTLIVKKHRMAITKDSDNKIFFVYDIRDDEIKKHTEGILKEVNSEIADEIQQYFGVDLADYGLVVTDDELVSMSM